MKKLTEVCFNPSNFDSRSNYIGEIPNNSLLVVLSRNRDSDLLDQSNWEVAIKRLKDSENVEIVRFGHWACGWIEYLCVTEGTKEANVGEEIEEQLDNYPILDEEHFSELEQKEANEVWVNCFNNQERLEYIRNNKDQFYFHDMVDLMRCVRGKYFCGYSSELIY